MFRMFHKIKYLLLIIAIIIIVLLIIIFPKARPGNYFPSKKMVKTFKGNLNNDEFIQLVDRLEGEKIQIKQIDSHTKVAMVYEISKHMVSLVYSQEVNNGFKDDYISNLKVNRDNIIIKTPLTIGTSWRDDIGGVYQIVEMDSIVKSPGGIFKTMVIEYTNDEFFVREHYAKDIGLVKIIINNYLVNELVNLEIIE